MNRTNRTAVMSLIAGLALSAPVFASPAMDKLMAELDAARQALNAHRENVQVLQAEVDSIKKTISAIEEEYAKSGDPELKDALAWEYSNLERHEMRLADEQNEVLASSGVVEKILAQINALDAAEQAGKTAPKSGKTVKSGATLSSVSAK